MFGLAVSELPAIVDNASILGQTDCFGGSVPVAGACVDQQAALFAESCWSAGEAKCTYGTGAFLLATTGADPVRSSHGLVGCVAWRLAGRPTWCLDGQVFTVGAAVSWLESVGVIDGPADLDRLGGSVPDAAGVTFVPGLAGLGAPFWAAAGARRAHRAVARDRAGPPGAGRHRGHRRAGGVAGSGRRRGPGEAARAPPRRRRSDTVAHPAPGAGRPPAGAGRGLPVAARHRARRRRLRPARPVRSVGRLPGGPELATAVPDWQAAAVVEPQISADEAEERLQSWRAAAEATLRL